MKIFILSAEHFHVPGLINKPFATMAGATVEAVELVNIMLKDSGAAPRATADDWQKRVEWLQDKHGAQFCYVDILEHELGA